MDGTLLNLNLEQGDLEDARERMFKLIAENIGSPETKSIFGMYRQAIANVQTDSSLVEALKKILDGLEFRAYGKITLNIPLNSFALEKKQEGATTGIVTNNGRKLLDSLLANQILYEGAFDLIVTRDDVKDIKPSPEPLFKILERLELSIDDEFLFIGDSVADQASAKNFNTLYPLQIKFIHVKDLELPSNE